MRRGARAALLSAGAAAGAPPPAAVRAILQAAADAASAKYNCSVAAAFHGASGAAVSAAAGAAAPGRPLLADDALVWGSVTKVLTGASVMSLAAEGWLDLDAPVATYVDPMLARMQRGSGGAQPFASLSDLFGAEVGNVTVRQMLAMQSGIPDFDTAMPCGGHHHGPTPAPPPPPPGVPPPPPCVPSDQLRQDLYNTPSHGYTPVDLLQLPWVATGKLGRGGYSSTNFMLLGMALALRRNVTSWDQLDQMTFLPPSVRGKYTKLAFGVRGAPRDFTPVHGYDRTTYNGNAGHSNDVWEVEGVFSGWTASDVIGTVEDIAQLAWDVYGPEYNFAPKNFIDQMVPGPSGGYGLATFNLSHETSQSVSGGYGIAYGHLGATYGYQSIVAYFPKLQYTMAVGTNVEFDQQPQAKEVLCIAYNKIAALELGKDVTCASVSGGYYGAACNCTALD